MRTRTLVVILLAGTVGFLAGRDTKGHIVTNFHVIDGGDSFKVRLADQSEYAAKVVGYAPDKDLAVLRVVGAPASSPGDTLSFKSTSEI